MHLKFLLKYAVFNSVSYTESSKLDRWGINRKHEQTYRHLFDDCIITSALWEETKEYIQSKSQTCIEFNISDIIVDLS